MLFATSLGCATHPERLGEVGPAKLFETCEVLTNRHVRVDANQPLARRKNAMRRMARKRCELLLQRIESKASPSLHDRKRMATLQRMRASYAEKQGLGIPPGVTQKLTMLFEGWRSRKRLRIPRQSACSQASPVPGIFWRPRLDRQSMSVAFERLAKKKKFEIEAPLIVVLDEVSSGGSAAKIKARDLNPQRDNDWVIKWGDEVHTDVVASRLFAALGFDVDHPYYMGPEQLIVLLDPGASKIQSPQALKAAIASKFGFKLAPWIAEQNLVTPEMVRNHPSLGPWLGARYLRFVEALVEARPDRVKRLGSFLPNRFEHQRHKSLRGALLAHLWLDNWDTRASNTLLTTLHRGNHDYALSAVFSDLGTSLGVELNLLPPDFKVGLVNALKWDLISTNSKDEVAFSGKINAWLAPYRQARYCDLRWMATLIARIDESLLNSSINQAGWPDAVAQLYFHKLAARRAQILEAFEISDPHPIPYDRNLSIHDQYGYVVRQGKLIQAPAPDPLHPESLVGQRGRLRGFGL